MDSKQYRQLVGRFATGITVVTTNNDGLLHGMTANAFTSLSLDPLQLLVCVGKQSVCHEQLDTVDAFGVSILAEDQEDLSNLFASSQEPEEGSLRGAGYTLGDALGVPLLDGALVHFECELADRLPGGDHTIIVGTVVAGDAKSDALPLLYYGGGYSRLASDE